MKEVVKAYPGYMPIIKWQKWEQKALAELTSKIKPKVLPCIEARTNAQHLSLMKDFSSVWNELALVDYANPNGILSGSRPHEFAEFLTFSGQEKYPIIPVINPLDPAAVTNKPLLSLAHKHKEVAYRLRLKKFQVDKLQQISCATALKQTIDAGCKSRLIIDLGVTPDEWSPIDLANLADGLEVLESLGFHSIHVASGSFPNSLANIKGAAKLNRRDWKLWAALDAAHPKLRVGFSDYGTLSPEWSEKTLTQRSNSVAIRYATNDTWLVLRTTGKTAAESIAISEILVNSYPSEFKGRPYSFGDAIIADRADSTVPHSNKKCGHYHITEAWNHHITFVVKEQYKK